MMLTPQKNHTQKTRLTQQHKSMTTTTTTKRTHRKKRFFREDINFNLKELLKNIASPLTIKTSKKPLSLTPSVRETKMNNHKRPRHISTCKIYPLFVLLLMLVQTKNVAYATNSNSTLTIKYSQPLVAEGNNEDIFRPIIPKDINLDYTSQNVFTKAGQYRVFAPDKSDLRAAVSLRNENKVSIEQSIEKAAQIMGVNSTQSQKAELPRVGFQQTLHNNTIKEHAVAKGKQIASSFIRAPTVSITTTTTPLSEYQTAFSGEMKELESLLAEYVDNFFNKAQYQPKPELIMALQQNYTELNQKYKNNKGGTHLPEITENIRPVRQAISQHGNGELSINIPRAFQSGRLLFFTGLKKVMWPIYMGLQILKSLMFALLLPTLIGSFGKLLGKGITSGSAPLFIRPMDEPQDLDFKDNNFNFEDDSNKFTSLDETATGGSVKDNGYAYNQAEASQTHNQYAYNAASINQQALSRYGMNERQQLMQDSYLSAIQSLGAASFKNSNGLLGSSSSSGGGGGGGLTAPMRQKPAVLANINTFQQFQKVPASSLLLSNYDPFYSPLLSRLDSVFAQLKLNSGDEACREKLICLMYANPAKYAPYSNLVSAQLSRELNELRKPTSDNPDILRFFKYMRAAKDGQDGIDCEKSFEKCKEFKDFENPAMVSTYHDINKLVQARKLM